MGHQTSKDDQRNPAFRNSPRVIREPENLDSDDVQRDPREPNEPTRSDRDERERERNRRPGR